MQAKTKRRKALRSEQSEEARSREREADRIQHAARRCIETAQETEERLADQKLRTAKRRCNETSTFFREILFGTVKLESKFRAKPGNKASK